ncbi:MAG: hypothetical protein AAFV53_18175 [Myxococcota bacterium]
MSEPLNRNRLLGAAVFGALGGALLGVSVVIAYETHGALSDLARITRTVVPGGAVGAGMWAVVSPLMMALRIRLRQQSGSIWGKQVIWAVGCAVVTTALLAGMRFGGHLALGYALRHATHLGLYFVCPGMAILWQLGAAVLWDRPHT